MDKKNIQYFILKILRGTSTVEEETQVNQHFQNSFQSEDWDEEHLGNKEEVRNRIVSRVDTFVSKEPIKLLGMRMTYIYYAAMVLVFFGFVVFGYYHYEREVPENNQLVSQEFLNPGSDLALLELNDGTILDLTNLSVGENRLKSGLVINKTDEGTLEYVADDMDNYSSEIKWNTLKTPIGGRYQIVLGDGTKVWLNSESSLSFPSGFSDDQRQVKASGEVYFEVAHDKSKPFFVETGGFEVEVLGTSFNLSNYQSSSEENEVPSLALIEGKVQLRTAIGDKAVLRPGQKAVLNKDKVELEEFDVESEIAWKNNYFIFKDENIKNIMRVVARWYDAEVLFDGNDWQDKNFTVRMSRRESIEEILSILELTKSVEFKIEERRISVFNK